jgi:hypothetical protein
MILLKEISFYGIDLQSFFVQCQFAVVGEEFSMNNVWCRDASQKLHPTKSLNNLLARSEKLPLQHDTATLGSGSSSHQNIDIHLPKSVYIPSLSLFGLQLKRAFSVRKTILGWAVSL